MIEIPFRPTTYVRILENGGFLFLTGYSSENKKALCDIYYVKKEAGNRYSEIREVIAKPWSDIALDAWQRLAIRYPSTSNLVIEAHQVEEYNASYPIKLYIENKQDNLSPIFAEGEWDIL